MKYLDRTWSDPAMNLACDEALLDACEEDPSCGVLRFFDPDRPFVVVGYGNSIAREVHLEACQAAGVPVLRRSSGGGTVVLAAGCLAYTVVLPISAHPELAGVTGTNRWVMDHQRRALDRLLGGGVQIEGHTDLTYQGRKCSGNAQRRRGNALLFHGTLLLNMDLAWISRCLKMPSLRPDYRADRPHDQFVANLGLDVGCVKEALREVWHAADGHDGVSETRMVGLMAERYGQPAWHARR